MQRFCKALAFALFCPLLLYGDGITYAVEFEGLDDPHVIKAMRSVTHLTTLKKRAPPSLSALRYRAEADIPDMIKILHANGYYEATVEVRVDELYDEKARVTIFIHPGPVYTIGSYEIDLFSQSPEEKILCSSISLDSIGIELGKAALTEQILNSEMRSLQLLSECGYPLAAISKRSFVADGETKSLQVQLAIDTGPLCYFGKAEIKGEKEVLPSYIGEKSLWKEGDLYNSALVESTQKSLLDTGLFNSILIKHGQKSDEQGNLPMQIDVTETKHHSVNIGASYQTIFGPGITFGWENRNVSGLGRTLHFQGDITEITHSGVASFHIPEFLRKDQEYTIEAQAMHESIKAYHMRSYSFLNRFERKIGKRMRLSIGVEAEEMLVTASVDNGNFFLLEMPFYFRYSTANSLLNPTSGITLQYKASPVINFSQSSGCYLYQEIVQNFYTSITTNRNLVLAQKITLGSILSSSLDTIPIPKRYLGGSEEELRGYHYRTVSPLSHHHKPIGGRSAIYYTLELRFRIATALGLVPFYDTGIVRSTPFPTPRGRWVSSAGIGVRYFSFIGPLRLDLGRPLNRRKHFDPKYKVYVSIGQMF